MNTTKYAPVLIPTLNRYVHFKLCIESLEKCKGAEHTDVYVALDYPPSDKYVDDWKKVDAYLQEKEKTNGFKSLIVHRRKENYFFSGRGNLESLIKDLPTDVDCYILSEDDNEFSPCFLDYMNQNLQKYKEDESIFCICGYLSMKDSCDSRIYSQFKSERYVAWGIGCWKDKYQDFLSFYNKTKVLDFVNSTKVQKYYKDDKRESILASIVAIANGAPLLGDVVLGAYMRYKDMYCILPTKSMVRNHGWDGSGSHGGTVVGYETQEICVNSDYVIKEALESFGQEYDERMHQRRRSRKLTLNEQAGRITWYLYKYTGIFCQFKGLHDFCKNIKNKLHGNK